MKKPTSHPMWRLRGQPLRLAVFVLLVTLWALASCSSDSETPLGAELADDILGSRPGSTFVDTLFVVGDTVVPTYTLIDEQPELELGIADEYERVMILRPDLSNVGSDPSKVVASARLRITMDAAYSPIRARFLNLGTRYDEGDRVPMLDTNFVLVDPGNGDAEVRTLTVVTPGTSYQLPTTVVEAWLDYPDSLNNGFAVVYTGTADSLARFESRQTNGGINVEGAPPQLIVTFADQSQSEYNMGADATFIRPLATTSDLILSDGFVRRIYWRINMDLLDTTLAVNKATARFYLVDGTVLGDPQTVNYYIPESTDPGSDEFLGGSYPLDPTRPSFPPVVNTTAGWVELPMTGAVFGVLRGTVPDNGFVLRYLSENRSVRQAEFYTSAAVNDTLRPRVIITASFPAEFDR